jgi:hypothetical protein
VFDADAIRAEVVKQFAEEEKAKADHARFQKIWAAAAENKLLSVKR